VNFAERENLFDNAPIAKFIETDLFFRRNLSGGKQVTQKQFQAFVDKVIIPRFPTTLSIFDTNGQFQDSQRKIIQEPSKVVKLLIEDTRENEIAIDEIISAYKEQFHQESVLLVVDEEVQVAFATKSTVATVPPENTSVFRLLIISNLVIIVINSTLKISN
jgi:Protein of unknown function (DUF3574)